MCTITYILLLPLCPLCPFMLRSVPYFKFDFPSPRGYRRKITQGYTCDALVSPNVRLDFSSSRGYRFFYYCSLEPFKC
ncbi:hypothetical protein BJ912DRAFT_1015177 [Pholiota molesta]|nr:hypothetical protein BJ912DRAFT_1016213 [Pholiota molesta]KAF8152811.1 hypothetical protein BJ912DRAFT_1015177 [Pholiota molesta]